MTQLQLNKPLKMNIDDVDRISKKGAKLGARSQKKISKNKPLEVSLDIGILEQTVRQCVVKGGHGKTQIKQ